MPIPLSGWGRCGFEDSWAAGGNPSAPRVSRVVDPHVGYVPPKGEIAGIPKWEWEPHTARTLVMPWPEYSAPVFDSLEDLSKRLLAAHRAGGPAACSAAELAKLDAGIDGLLAILAQSHAVGRPFGFLQLGSVLQVKDRGLVLPDVGFYWDSKEGPFVPVWLELLEKERSWGPRVRETNERLTRALVPPGDAASATTLMAEDLKQVGWLVAEALVGAEKLKGWAAASGGWLNAVPDASKAPEAVGPVWDVIAKAVAGEIRSATQLAEDFRRFAPGSHFRRVPPTPPRPPNPLRRVVPAFLGLALVGSIVGLLYYLRPEPPVPPAVCPECVHCGELHPHLVAYEAVLRSADLGTIGSAEEWGALDAMFEIAAKPGFNATADAKACLERLRGEFLSRLEGEANRLRENLRNRPAISRRECVEIGRILQLFESQARRAAAGVKESPWQAKLLREQRLRGCGPAPSPAP